MKSAQLAERLEKPRIKQRCLVIAAERFDQRRCGVVVAVAGAVIAVVAGVASWYITRFRFTDEQLQLRTGLLSRRVLTAPLDRVRLEAPIPRPARNVFCLGRNYAEHAAELQTAVFFMNRLP
mgnify:CR=1 FL=1